MDRSRKLAGVVGELAEFICLCVSFLLLHLLCLLFVILSGLTELLNKSLWLARRKRRAALAS